MSFKLIHARIKNVWVRFWMRYSGLTSFGRTAAWLATLATPPFYGRIPLASQNPGGYISPRAIIQHTQFYLGANNFIDDGVLIYQDNDGGSVDLADAVHLHRETIIQTGYGGSLIIGSHTHIQPRCHFSAYLSHIRIGCEVDIAPYCSFYSYNHGKSPGKPIRHQPLQTKGGIIIKDGAWLGVGVIVLDGVTIGNAAVIGAGAVVTRDVPDGATAVGSPARIVDKPIKND